MLSFFFNLIYFWFVCIYIVFFRRSSMKRTSVLFLGKTKRPPFQNPKKQVHPKIDAQFFIFFFENPMSLFFIFKKSSNSIIFEKIRLNKTSVLLRGKKSVLLSKTQKNKFIQKLTLNFLSFFENPMFVVFHFQEKFTYDRNFEFRARSD